MKPSIKDIALDTGLSITTVSKYLRNKHIREKNRLRIEESIKRMGYVPNRNAQMLRSGKTYMIGVVIEDLSNTFWGSIVDYIEEYLKQQGYMIAIYSGKEMELGGQYLANILAQHPDGLIVALRDQNKHTFIPLMQRRLPLVLLDQKSSYYDLDIVTSDNYEGGKSAAYYLYKMGHSKIGIITGWRNIYTLSERVRGFLDGLAECKISVPPEYIVEGPMTSMTGKELFSKLMQQENPPEAIFATNLDLGQGMLIEANLKGYRIGKDISCITFDDTELFAGMLPPVTVVTQNVKQIGIEAAKLILVQLDEKEKTSHITHLIPTQLIERSSVMNKREKS